ncbi:MAG: 2-oxo acid dehydrogenase subunit E2 [Candidatus Diapherotrites archaeon]|nr:2-oxo acid dehydrogenase subunit E2 [Candidatus Diapherotrites archaeon]
MALEFRFPDVGEGITEGTLIKWLVKEGDTVKADQPVAEIETGKAIVEVPAPSAGKVEKFFFKEGAVIKVGEVLFSLSGGTESKPETKAPAVKTVEKRESFGVVGELEEAPTQMIQVQVKSKPAKEKDGHIEVLPSTRKLAKDIGVDLTQVKGTGKDGRVTSTDVQKAAQIKIGENAGGPGQSENPASRTQASAPQVHFEKYGRILSIPLTPVRKEIARRMSLSAYTSPHAVAMEEIDVTELAAVREKQKVFAENKGIHLTYMAFIVKACVGVLKEHPYLNAFLDGQSQQIIVKQYYNIGIAVDTPNGLMVPNVKEAEKKSIIDVAHEIELLAQKARDRTISLEELSGGTFTITNYGSIAGTFGVPIINYGESAILGTGRIHDKPVVKNGQVVVRKILPVSLSFDHRVVDGAQAAEFLADLKKHLEDPSFLLVEID